MAKDSKEDFRFTDKNLSPNKLYQDEANEIRLEKLNNRVTLISILLPVLIIVILAVAYLDITRKVTTVEFTGSSELDTLSKNLQSNFSSLSLKFAAQEETFGNRIKSLDTAQHELARRLRFTEAELRHAHAGLRELERSSVTRTDLDKATAQLSENVTVLQKNMQVLDQNFSALDAAVKKELASVAGVAEKSGTRIDTLSQRIDALSKEKADQDSLADMLLAMDRQGRTLQKSLKDSIDLVNARIEALDHRLAILERHIHSHPATEAARPKETTATRHAPAAASKPKPQSGAAASSPGGIDEQPLQ